MTTKCGALRNPFFLLFRRGVLFENPGDELMGIAGSSSEAAVDFNLSGFLRLRFYDSMAARLEGRETIVILTFAT